MVMQMMRRLKLYKTGIFLLVFLSASFLFLMAPLDSIGYYCSTSNFSNGCLCVRQKSELSPLKGDREIVHLNDLQYHTSTKCLMTIIPQGRLGNLMGEYATLYALARLNGRPAFVDAEMASQMEEYFDLSLPVLDKAVGARLPWRKTELEDWMIPDYRDLAGRFVKLTGYPCSWTFYDHVREEIMREFTFRPHIVHDVNLYLKMIRGKRSQVTYIGVHIRRGDYIKLMKEDYIGVVADAEYLAEAMQRFRIRYQDALFVVCSDDLEWAKKNIENSKEDVVFCWNGQSSTPGRDMALLSHCNHSIMTIGTFGYWSSYLAAGETIYLHNFTHPQSKFLKVFHYDAAFLPHWEGISANLSSLPSVLPSGTNVKTVACNVVHVCCLILLALFYAKI